LNGPKHARALARELHARWPELSFDLTAKVEHIIRHAELLPELAASGCVFIVSAIESRSDVVLDHLRKGHTRADIDHALALLRQASIALRASLVAFTPWTTARDYLDLLEWVEAEALWEHIDPVQYAIRLLVPHGSLLAEYAPMLGYLGPFDPKSMVYPWRHPDARMDTLASQVMRVVADGTKQGHSAREIFDGVRILAEALNPGVLRGVLRDRPEPSPVPHLTEPWFCCAEPLEAESP
jgi:hypothetical protein